MAPALSGRQRDVWLVAEARAEHVPVLGFHLLGPVGQAFHVQFEVHSICGLGRSAEPEGEGPVLSFGGEGALLGGADAGLNHLVEHALIGIAAAAVAAEDGVPSFSVQ